MERVFHNLADKFTPIGNPFGGDAKSELPRAAGRLPRPDVAAPIEDFIVPVNALA